jgi:aminomethyltransferase
MNPESSTEGTTAGQLRRTPLHGFHQRHGARFVDFGGWEMPVQYQSILDEHRAVREAAGLFDVSHMGELTVEGPQAETFLDHLLTNLITGQPDGKAIYSPMCYPDGGTVDDLLVYRWSATRFLLCVNAANISKDTKWIRAQAHPFDCQVEDVSDSYALLALQGPQAAAILQPLTTQSLEQLRYYTFTRGTLDGIDAILSRTGYTGEDGFELFIPPSAAEKIADTLLQTGAAAGLQPAGLGARDSLRLEAGFALYGHELSDQISPIQAGLGWTVRFDKEHDFVGRTALENQKKNGPDPRVVYFRTHGRRIIRAGASLLTAEGEGGTVLSGTLSPHLNEAVGSALLHQAALGKPLHAEIRGQAVPIEIVKPPFYRRAASS